MPVPWVPLLPSEQVARESDDHEQASQPVQAHEGFKSDDNIEQFITSDEKATMVNVLVGVGLMTLAIIVSLIFAWAYNTDRALFIVVLGIVMFAFSVNMLIYMALIRKNMSKAALNYYLGITAFMSFVNLLIVILFTTIYMRRDR